jgi:hypothetical protein
VLKITDDFPASRRIEYGVTPLLDDSLDMLPGSVPHFGGGAFE